jgi:hypothetical protein
MRVIPFSANTGFNAPHEPFRWKVENFLTGFTFVSCRFRKSEESVFNSRGGSKIDSEE